MGLDALDSAALQEAQPSPALQPREVISTMLCALNEKNLDAPRARFGSEVALRFLAPSNPASKLSPQKFAEYLGQVWYQPLLQWSEYRWEGELVILSNGKEAFQQVSVREADTKPWTSVRWILSLCPMEAGDEWRVESVFVAQTQSQEPDGSEYPRCTAPEVPSAESWPVARETPTEVVTKVMRALKNPDEPYPLHGCEVAIRYCSPSNAASRLSPKAFAQYLREPWYRVLTEWEEMDVDMEEEDYNEDGSVVQVGIPVRRGEGDSWTIVNWELSLHGGRWLTDSLSITE